MNTFTYSADLDSMLAQCERAKTMGRDARRAASIATLLAVASWKRANEKKVTQAEFGKAVGLSQPAVSQAVQVLKHADAMGVVTKNGRACLVPDDSVAYLIVGLVDQYMGKAVSGIYAEMYGKEDKWNLSKAVATLIASAEKRDIPLSVVLEEVLGQMGQTDMIG